MIHSRMLGLWLPFLFYSSLLLFSTFIFEMGVYSDEIGEVGYPVGAPLLLLQYIFVSCCIFFLVWRVIPKPIRNFEVQIFNTKYIFIFFLGCLAYYLTPIFMYGPSILRGINRYQFGELPLVSTFNIKLFLGILCAPLGSIYATSTKVEKKIALLLFFGFLIGTLLYGEKMSGPTIGLIFFTSGFLVAFNKKISLFKLSKFTLVLLSIFIFIFFFQLILLGNSIEDIGLHFANRLGRQGQLWWKTIALLNDGELVKHSQGFELIESYWSVVGLDIQGGMRYMMPIVMEANAFLQHSGSLAGGYPAILLYIDGGDNFLFYSAIMAFAYIIPMYLYLFLFYSSPLTYYTIPFGLYFISVHLKIFNSGNIYLLSSPKYFVLYLVSLNLIPLALFSKIGRGSKTYP